VRLVGFSPDSSLLVTRSDDETIMLWHLGFSDLVRIACRTTARRLTSKELEDIIGDEQAPRPCTEQTQPNNVAPTVGWLGYRVRMRIDCWIVIIGLLRFYRHFCKDLGSGLEVATQPHIPVPRAMQYFAENRPRRSHGLIPARPVRIGSSSSSGVDLGTAEVMHSRPATPE
jgi:hypothetical protein